MSTLHRSTLARAAIAACLVIAAGSSHAGLDGEIQDMFDGMVMSNTTTPQISMGQRRGVITGGSVHLRTRNVRSGPLITVDPPRFRGGAGACGSIDLMGASFSIMSSDQLKQLPRAILANAGAMAISIALNAVSPQLEDKMAYYMDKINKYSQFELNSCEIAAQMVGPESQAGMAIDSYFRSMVSEEGGGDSITDTRASNGTPAAATVPEERKPEIQPNNILWKAISQQGAQTWFASGDRATNEAIVSMVGTIVICTKDANCKGTEGTSSEPAPDGTPRYQTYGGILGLKDLIYGTEPGSPQSGAKTWKCVGSTDANGCLTMVKSDLENFPGLNKMVRDITLGTYGNLGIIDRIRADLEGPTPREEAFLVNTGKFGGILLNLAKRNATAAKDFVERYSTLIAAELAENLVERMLNAADQALSSEVNGMFQTEQRALLREARERLQWEKGDIRSRAQEHETMLAYYIRQLEASPVLSLPSSPRG